MKVPAADFQCTNPQCECGKHVADDFIQCSSCHGLFEGYQVRRVYTKYVETFKSLSQGVCNVCSETRWLDASGTCSSCIESRHRVGWTWLCNSCADDAPKICVDCNTLSDVLAPNGRCPTCAYGANWKESSKNAFALRNCSSCGRRFPVNENGICIHCYTDHRLDEARRNMDDFALRIGRCYACDEFVESGQKYCSYHRKMVRACPDCGTQFVADYDNQWQCIACLPKCVSCGDSFVPVSRADALCDDCIAYKRKGLCTSCHTPDVNLTDAEGWCSKCCEEEYNEEGYDFAPKLCGRCHETEVMYAGDICSSCRSKTFRCPSCHEFKLDYSEIVCKDCREKHV